MAAKRKAASASAKSRKEALLKQSGIEREQPEPDEQIMAKGRAGRKGVVIYLNPVAKKALSDLARDRGKSLQDLGVEAINHLFRTYGKKPIA